MNTERDNERYLDSFYISIIDLSENFSYDTYVKLINEFRSTLGLADETMNSGGVILNFSQTAYTKLMLITDYILNLKNLFFSITNKSLELSYDFIISLVENKYYNDINYVIGLVYRLVSKRKVLNAKTVIRLSGISRDLPSKNITDSIIRRLETYHKQNKRDLIKIFRSIDNELSLLQYNDPNISELSISMIESFDEFKVDINQQLKRDAILQHFYINYLQRIYDRSCLACPEDFSDEYIRYLYIVKKTVDHIDEMGKDNTYLQKLFLNILMRSKTFLRVIMCQVNLNFNFVYFCNKDIYVETYGILGRYLEQITTCDKSVFAYYKNIGAKLINLIKNHLSTRLNELFANFSIQSFKFTESLLNESPIAYLSSFPIQSLCHNWLYLDLNIKTTGNVSEIMNMLTSYLFKVKPIKKITSNDNVIYLNCKVEHLSSCLEFTIMLTINSELIFRGNQLFEIIHSNDLFVELFKCLKFWAIQRGLLITPEHKFIDLTMDCFLDTNLLMYYMIYYLIKARAIERLRPNGFKSEYRILKSDEHSYYYEQYKSYNYNLNKPIKNYNMAEVAKLFINFFHFNISITDKLLKDCYKQYTIDLNYPDIVKSKNKDYVLQLVDFLVLSNHDAKIVTNHSEMLNKHETTGDHDISVSDKHFRKILNNFYYRDITLLEKESYRVLHYVLNDSFDQSNVRFAKIFIPLSKLRK
jgi:hypothetical protein